MSNQQSSSFTSYSSVSYSSSSSRDGEQVSGSRHMQTTHTDDSGTTVKTAHQNYGEPVVQEERRFDSEGRQIVGGGSDANRRIEDVDEEQRQRDKEYEERIEEEYAKREGGA